MSNFKDTTKISETSEPICNIHAQVLYNSVDLHGQSQKPDDYDPWSKKNVFYSWLLICYSTGPTSAMSRTYISACIQSLGYSLGHPKDFPLKKCARKGSNCLVKFGRGEINVNSFTLYLKAIYTSLEGIVTILLMGIADFANYKKQILITTIILFGCLSLPFAGLTKKSYSVLNAMSVLYCLQFVLDSIYQTITGSYIPLFMRSEETKHLQNEHVDEEQTIKRVFNVGSRVSSLGLIIGNIGGITALLIGIIITYGRGSAIKEGYHNFLLAITIAGCITVTMAVISSFYLPSTKGLERPVGENLLVLSFKRFISLVKDIRKYPEAFKLVIGWIFWNISYSNFLSVYGLLFRSTLGIGSSDAEYTVYAFMQYVVASLGSLLWMIIFRKTRFSLKAWALLFLTVSLFTNFWATLGIGKRVAIGFKHRAEFWVFLVIYTSTSSALRALNRVLYSSLLPKGQEAKYFGLEIMLGVATGWVGSLVIAVIQDRTGNLRWPLVPNMFLVVISIFFYLWIDLEKGKTFVLPSNP